MATPTANEPYKNDQDHQHWPYYSRFHPYGGRNGGIIWGIFMIVIGILFLLKNFNLLPIDFSQLWPIFIIIPGIFIVLNARNRQ